MTPIETVPRATAPETEPAEGSAIAAPATRFAAIAGPSRTLRFAGALWIAGIGVAASLAGLFTLAGPGVRFWGFLWAWVGAFLVLRGIGNRSAGTIASGVSAIVGTALLVAVPSEAPMPPPVAGIVAPAPPAIVREELTGSELEGDQLAQARINSVRMLLAVKGWAESDVPAVKKGLELAALHRRSKRYTDAVFEAEQAREAIGKEAAFREARYELTARLHRKTAADLDELLARADRARAEGRYGDALTTLDVAKNIHAARHW